LFLVCVAVVIESPRACAAEQQPAAAVKATPGEQFIADAKRLQVHRRAKNIILFIGDGMGVSTITATRIFGKGTAHPNNPTNSLSFEAFPYRAMSKTYSADFLTTDSAPGMSGPMCGVKCRNDTLGVDGSVAMGQSIVGHCVPTFMERCKAMGKRCGIVTTTRITHATPAACYAHTSNRDWEGANDKPDKTAWPAGVRAIANQLLGWPGGVDVALGGGRAKFKTKDQQTPVSKPQPGDGDKYALIDEWANGKQQHHHYVCNRAQLLEALPGKQLLGLFHDDHMSFNLDRDPQVEPSLTEMTVKAIELLRNECGFFLMVEGGRIDHAHHSNQINKALDDTTEFAHAVAAAVELVDQRDTLIIVTADHSHTLTTAGFAAIGTKINGITMKYDEQHQLVPAKDALDRPFGYLVYGDGSLPCLGGGYVGFCRPLALTDAIVGEKDYRAECAIPAAGGKLSSGGYESHSGDDVVIYATGAGAHLVHGTMENTFIYNVMLEAAGLAGSSR
jgi:alkaline phosphatase